MSEQVRAIVVLGVMAALLALTLVALVFIARALRDTSVSMGRLHQQQATIVRMLLRAGFRPPGTARDWFDDPHKTQAVDEQWYTQWDLRRPQ